MHGFGLKLVGIAMGAGLAFAFGSPRDRDMVPAALRAATLREACKDGCTHAQRNVWNDTLTVEAQDLNGDSKPELLVHVRNTAADDEGNTTWVFEQTGKESYRLLVVGSTLTVSKETHGRWHDLQGTVWFADAEPQPYTFRYQNGAYQVPDSAEAMEASDVL